MVDISEEIRAWTKCCVELWDNWFVDIENGADEFLEVEDTIFSTLVLSQLPLDQRPRLDEVYRRLRATYREDLNSERSVCCVQKNGNIYCESSKVVQKKGTWLRVRAIDCLGTMLNGEAYVELEVGNGKCVLEPIDNLKICFEGIEERDPN